MAYLNDRVLDLGLNILQGEVDRLDICTALPATFADATVNFTCGEADGAALPTVSAPEAGVPNGRQVSVGVTDHAGAVVTDTDIATHVALSDTVNNRLLAARELDAPQGVTLGNPFTLTAFTIRFPEVAP